jgi:hypothetical protein
MKEGFAIEPQRINKTQSEGKELAADKDRPAQSAENKNPMDIKHWSQRRTLNQKTTAICSTIVQFWQGENGRNRLREE